MTSTVIFAVLITLLVGAIFVIAIISRSWAAYVYTWLLGLIGGTLRVGFLLLLILVPTFLVVGFVLGRL